MNEERRRVELQLRKYFSHNQEDSYLQQTITAAVVMLYCHILIQAQCGRNAVLVLSYTRRTMKEQ